LIYEDIDISEEYYVVPSPVVSNLIHLCIHLRQQQILEHEKHTEKHKLKIALKTRHQEFEGGERRNC
jgi:hypothetical protein